MSHLRFATILTTAVLLSVQTLGVNELQATTLTLADQQRLDITLYNQDLALIVEQRHAPMLPPGTRVYVEDTSSALIPESLRIEGVGRIAEQSRLSSVLSYTALLHAHIGESLQLARLNAATGAETLEVVELLAVEGDRALVRTPEHIMAVPLQDSQWRFMFSTDLPGDLRARSGLQFLTEGTAAPGVAHLSYLTRAMGWQMDYVVTLDAPGERLKLDGLASIYNQTGTHFSNAHISLMAGDIQAPEIIRNRAQSLQENVMMASPSMSRESTAPESFQDYHLYRLPEPLSVRQAEQKQVPLIQLESIAAEISYHHQFYVSGAVESNTRKANPLIQLAFVAPNLDSYNAGQGAPLPAGQVRVFRPDSLGQLQFMGASSIGNVAAGNPAELQIGRAFDLEIEQRQVLFNSNFNSITIQQEVRIKNSGNTGREVQMSAVIPGEWELKNSSDFMQRDSAGMLSWRMHSAAKGEATVRFTVELLRPAKR